MGRRPKQPTELLTSAHIEVDMFVTKRVATPELVKLWMVDKANAARKTRTVLDKTTTIAACRAHFQRDTCPEDWAASAFEDLPDDVKQRGRPRRPR